MAVWATENRRITSLRLGNSPPISGTLVKMAELSPKELRQSILRFASEHPEFLEDLRPALEVIAKEQDRTKALERRKRLSKMMEFGGSFGALSGFVPGNPVQSKIRKTQLISDLNRLGYRKITPLAVGPTDDSLLVQNMLPQDLFALGRKYGQEVVLYKGKDGVIGLYNLQGEPNAEVGIAPKGDPAFQIATDPSLYVRTKNMSFDYGFLWADQIPWDGNLPVDRKQMQLFVQRGSLHD